MTLTIRTVTDTTPKRPRAIRISLAGSLDTATSPDLEQELAKILQDKPRLIVFDLAGLKFISSAGIRVLAIARQRMDEVHGLCVVAHPQPQVEKVLEIIRTLPGLSIFKDQAELDAYLMEIQQKILSGELPGQA
jgi:anti-sigma B factor antagonist